MADLCRRHLHQTLDVAPMPLTLLSCNSLPTIRKLFRHTTAQTNLRSLTKRPPLSSQTRLALDSLGVTAARCLLMFPVSIMKSTTVPKKPKRHSHSSPPD